MRGDQSSSPPPPHGTFCQFSSFLLQFRKSSWDYLLTRRTFAPPPQHQTQATKAPSSEPCRSATFGSNPMSRTLMDMIPVLQAETAPSTQPTRGTKRKRERTAPRRWSELKQQANRRNIRLAITREHHARLIKSPCMYCAKISDFAGVDRARNDEGYTPGNSVPCCTPCNMAKRDRGIGDFVAHARAIAKHSRGIRLNRASSCPCPPPPGFGFQGGGRGAQKKGRGGAGGGG